MDFKDDLKAAVEEAVEKQRNAADHVLRQAFFAGVAFYMEWLRKKAETPSEPPKVS